jgi:SAM-dependent methyltransferase
MMVSKGTPFVALKNTTKPGWKYLALLGQVMAMFPRDLAYRLYYLAQLHGGGLKNRSPQKQLENSVIIAEAIREQHREISGKTFLELGTGRTLNVPMGLWLCGAGKVITIDVNPYLKKELIGKSIDWLRQKENNVRVIFGDFAQSKLFNERLAKLVTYRDEIDSLIKIMNVEYLIQSESNTLPLANDSVDYFFSTYVLEHIPPVEVVRIIREARRIMRRDGLLIHIIDLSDHFSHYDKTITAVNFLQFSEEEWHKLAGNRFFYLNRLRSYEWYQLLATQHVEILSKVELRDDRALDLLKQGFPLDRRFSGHAPKELAVCDIIPLVGRFV